MSLMVTLASGRQPKTSESPLTSPPIVRHTVQRDNYQEVYLTLTQREEDLDAQFDALARAIVEAGFEPITEKVFGSLDEQEAIRSARARAYTHHGLEPTRPFVLVEGASTVADAPLAGIQLWGVTVGDGQRVTTLRTDDGATRLWRSPGFELAWVCHTDRRLEEASSSPRGQARALLERAGTLLAAHKMSFADVHRTWFYLAEILDWYPEFNRLRSRFFDEVGLRQDAAGLQLPASTGIQGRTGQAECALDLLAAHGDVRFTPIRSSSRQGPAASYGSSFSRAAIMELCGEKTLFVSGTASIDDAGRASTWATPKGKVWRRCWPSRRSCGSEACAGPTWRRGRSISRRQTPRRLGLGSASGSSCQCFPWCRSSRTSVDQSCWWSSRSSPPSGDERSHER